MNSSFGCSSTNLLIGVKCCALPQDGTLVKPWQQALALLLPSSGRWVLVIVNLKWVSEKIFLPTADVVATRVIICQTLSLMLYLFCWRCKWDQGLSMVEFLLFLIQNAPVPPTPFSGFLVLVLLDRLGLYTSYYARYNCCRQIVVNHLMHCDLSFLMSFLLLGLCKFVLTEHQFTCGRLERLF